MKKAGKDMLVRMWRKGNPCVLLVGMQTGAATVENSKEIPQKVKIQLPSNPEIPLWVPVQRKQKH